MIHDTLIQFNTGTRRGRWSADSKAGWFVSVLNTPTGTQWRRRFKQLNPNLIITTYGRNRVGHIYNGKRGEIFKRYVLYLTKKTT
jgi:hypothetical protein